jgi:hypothetical protein
MVLQNSLPNNDLGNSVRQYGARQFNSFTSSETVPCDSFGWNDRPRRSAHGGLIASFGKWQSGVFAMRFVTVSASAVHFAIATLSVFVIGFAASGLSATRELSPSEMELLRGTSTNVCKYTQSCDAYNHFSGECAGQQDGTTCTACWNGSGTVTYLDTAKNGCNPPPPGIKYDTTAGNFCGTQSFTASCVAGQCNTTVWSFNFCTEPNDIISQ